MKSQALKPITRFHAHLLQLFEEKPFWRNIAYVVNDSEVTHEWLYKKAAGIRAEIQKLDPNRRNVPVLVHGHKSPEMVASFLACLSLGRPYVPADESIPDGRLQNIADISKATLLLETSSSTRQLVTSPEIVRLRVCDVELADIPLDDIQRDFLQPDETMYIMFTSGSTGAPKGVQLAQLGLDQFIDWTLTDFYPRGVPKVFVNHVLFGFDVSMFELWASLCSGGKLVALDHRYNVNTRHNIELMQKHQAEAWISTPTMAELLLVDRKFKQASIPSLHTFIMCGEVLGTQICELLRDRFPGCDIVNAYGPTEATVAVTSIQVSDDLIRRKQSLPIGYRRPWVDVKILDEEDKPCGPHEVGEIVIKGDAISVGYLNPPQGKPSPFLTLDGERAYRTGDLGYYDDTGNFFFKGRRDRQIKLNGNRIELEEIEATCLRFPEVTAAVCFTKQKDDKVSRILCAVAFSTIREDIQWELRAFLKENLPSYMIPSDFHILDEVPIGTSGKVDRKLIEERAKQWQ